MSYYYPVAVLLLLTPNVFSFTCYSCNSRVGEDDTELCRDRPIECEKGSTACSTVTYRDFEKRLHVRKFCTPQGTPLYQYLSIFPGSAVCQNIQSPSFLSPRGPQPPSARPFNDTSEVKEPAGPPASQEVFMTTLLCVCTKEKCNGGLWEDVLVKGMMQNLYSNPRTHKLSKGEFADLKPLGKVTESDIFF